MKSRIILVLPDHIIAENKAVDRLCIQDRGVKRIERVVFDHDSAMEILLLILQVGYLRIDGNNGIGELEHIRQRVDKLIVADQHIVAGACFEPSVTIAAKQDSRAGSMVEDIVFHHRPPGCAEEGTAGAVVADHIVGKIDRRRPLVLQMIRFLPPVRRSPPRAPPS